MSQESTPLHLAAQSGVLEAVKALLLRGASVHAQDVSCCVYENSTSCLKVWIGKECADVDGCTTLMRCTLGSSDSSR